MNVRLASLVLGRVLQINAGLLLLPLITGLVYHEGAALLTGFLPAILISFVIGTLLTLVRQKSRRMYARDGMVICTLSWVMMSLTGALPLWLSGSYPSLVDAFFETASGFTTTGSSVQGNVEGLSHSILFWRSLTHLVGGMGVLVFVLAILPRDEAGNVFIAKAEMPGPQFGKLVSHLKTTARLLYAIYLALTCLLTIALLLCGMPFFDAVCHAFATAGTGGFGIKNASIAAYPSSAVHVALSIGMLVFGLNFNLFYLILLRQFRAFLKDEELRWYLSIVCGAVLLICLNVSPLYKNKGLLARDVFFTVSSLITTTGFATANFDLWPTFSKVILLALMFVGGMAGSTAGGLKVSRIAIYIKSAFAELRRQREPRRVIKVLFNEKPLPDRQISGVMAYLTAYIGLFLLLLLIVSPAMPDFPTAFSAVSATFNNIGPGLNAVGPTRNFAEFPAYVKLALSFGMILGRLEIWPVLIMFSRRTWKKI